MRAGGARHRRRYYPDPKCNAGRGRRGFFADKIKKFLTISLRKAGRRLGTERRKLADLKAAEYNPRKALTPDDAEYQKIRRSIEEFGYVDPIIINEDGTIIGGHQRATVLKDLGYQEVDVVVVALDKQRRL